MDEELKRTGFEKEDSSVKILREEVETREVKLDKVNINDKRFVFYPNRFSIGWQLLIRFAPIIVAHLLICIKVYRLSFAKSTV